MSELSTLTEPTQILLPGSAIVSVYKFDKKATPYGDFIYSAIFLNHREPKIIKNDHSRFDFSYYLANTPSIMGLVNNPVKFRKENCVVSGFTPEDFSDLERLFKDHREAMKGFYMVSLRGGRVNYI